MIIDMPVSPEIEMYRKILRRATYIDLTPDLEEQQKLDNLALWPEYSEKTNYTIE